MSAFIVSLINADQTLDSVVLPAFGRQTRGGSTAALAAAVAAKTIQMTVTQDEHVTEDAPETTYRITPLTGVSYQVPDDAEHVAIEPAGTIAALTTVFPNNPYDGQVLRINNTTVITAWTMTAGTTGQTNGIKGALTAGVANGFGTWKYNLAGLCWYRCG